MKKMTDELKIEELKRRGFEDKVFMDNGFCLCKDYKNDYHYYAIVISYQGDVLLVNYDKENTNMISFNFNLDFVDDLIFILQHLERINN